MKWRVKKLYFLNRVKRGMTGLEYLGWALGLECLHSIWARDSSLFTLRRAKTVAKADVWGYLSIPHYVSKSSLTRDSPTPLAARGKQHLLLHPHIYLFTPQHTQNHNTPPNPFSISINTCISLSLHMHVHNNCTYNSSLNNTGKRLVPSLSTTLLHIHICIYIHVRTYCIVLYRIRTSKKTNIYSWSSCLSL